MCMSTKVSRHGHLKRRTFYFDTIRAINNSVRSTTLSIFIQFNLTQTRYCKNLLISVKSRIISR
jgi:hypothetical protein